MLSPLHRPCSRPEPPFASAASTRPDLPAQQGGRGHQWGGAAHPDSCRGCLHSVLVFCQACACGGSACKRADTTARALAGKGSSRTGFLAPGRWPPVACASVDGQPDARSRQVHAPVSCGCPQSWWWARSVAFRILSRRQGQDNAHWSPARLLTWFPPDDGPVWLLRQSVVPVRAAAGLQDQRGTSRQSHWSTSLPTHTASVLRLQPAARRPGRARLPVRPAVGVLGPYVPVLRPCHPLHSRLASLAAHLAGAWPLERVSREEMSGRSGHVTRLCENSLLRARCARGPPRRTLPASSRAPAAGSRRGLRAEGARGRARGGVVVSDAHTPAGSARAHDHHVAMVHVRAHHGLPGGRLPHQGTRAHL